MKSRQNVRVSFKLDVKNFFNEFDENIGNAPLEHVLILLSIIKTSPRELY